MGGVTFGPSEDNVSASYTWYKTNTGALKRRERPGIFDNSSLVPLLSYHGDKFSFKSLATSSAAPQDCWYPAGLMRG